MFLSHGNKTVRAPPEFLRPASLREWNQLTLQERNQPVPENTVGGASQYIDLQRDVVNRPEEPSAASRPAAPHGEIPLPVSAMRNPPARVVPQLSRTSEHGSELGQPEQELTPQVSAMPPSAEGQAGGLVSAPTASETVPEDLPLPDDAEEGLVVDMDEVGLLAVENLPAGHDSNSSVAHRYEFHAGDLPDVLLAEDDLPWHAQPLQHDVGEAYSLEIPLKARDVAKWLRETNPLHMAHVATAGKRAHAEVSVRSLTESERRLFQEAKDKELNCWLQTSAVRRILRSKLNPEQILRPRWVLTWKAPEDGGERKRDWWF